jgi:Kef-type K+ transport system membrane component KefB
MTLGLPATLSDRLVQLIDIVFAVVIAESLARYSDEIVGLSSPRTLVALLGVYVVTVSSWWFYYVSMKKYPYTETRIGTARFAVDLFTVVLYVYLLYSVAQIESSDNVVRYVSGFPFVFVAYIASGILRRWEYKKPGASRVGLLLTFAVLLGACASAYHFLYSGRPSEAAAWNWLFIVLPPLLVIAFRVSRRRFYEERTQ